VGDAFMNNQYTIEEIFPLFFFVRMICSNCSKYTVKAFLPFFVIAQVVCGFFPLNRGQVLLFASSF